MRAMRLQHLTKREAEGFYAVHRERPFFGGLTDFMSSGPCVLLALEAPDAIKKWRATMGATDPAKADAGTLRKDFGDVDRAQRDARVGCARDGGVRARIFLPRDGTDLSDGRGRRTGPEWAARSSSSGLARLAGAGAADDARAPDWAVAGRFHDPKGKLHVLLSAGDVNHRQHRAHAV